MYVQDDGPTVPCLHNERPRRHAKIPFRYFLPYTTSLFLPLINQIVYVEEGPPTDIADRIGTSFPLHFLRLLHQRVVQEVAKADEFVTTFFLSFQKR
jgi:hypothetical protein